MSEIKWMPRKVVSRLCGAIAALLLAHLSALLWLPPNTAWTRLLDVNREKNIPTAFATLCLLICAVLLWQVSQAKQSQAKQMAKPNYGSALARDRRFWAHWRSLSLLFFILAVDECTMLHERLNMFLDDQFQTRGIFYYDWVIPGSLFVLLVLLAYARFLAHLTRATRRRFLIAGSLYLVGAIGMEMASGYYIDIYGIDTHGIETYELGADAVLTLLNSLEEAAEMLGTVCFIRALLIYREENREAILVKNS
jgi:hypothetical protein